MTSPHAESQTTNACQRSLKTTSMKAISHRLIPGKSAETGPQTLPTSPYLMATLASKISRPMKLTILSSSRRLLMTQGRMTIGPLSYKKSWTETSTALCKSPVCTTCSQPVSAAAHLSSSQVSSWSPTTRLVESAKWPRQQNCKTCRTCLTMTWLSSWEIRASTTTVVVSTIRTRISSKLKRLKTRQKRSSKHKSYRISSRRPNPSSK